MNKVFVSCVTAVALFFGVATPANAAATWPAADVMWTVNDVTGKLTARNPITHVVTETIKGSKAIHNDVIGGTWDAVHAQFILVDGWTYHFGRDNNSGLAIYKPSTRKWTRYAIDLGSGNTKGYSVRDIAVALDGTLVLLVERNADNQVQANYLVTVTKLNKKKKKATAKFSDSSTVHLAEVDNIFNSIVFDPSTPGVLYAADYGYHFHSIDSGNGTRNWVHSIFTVATESSQMDIDSTGHFWAYGDYGNELSYGLIANGSQNEEVEASTGFTNTLNVFIIQRG